MYPLLEKSYKGRFPFRIGSPSFIYPADYVPNVKRLGPYLDEIELLLFDSTYPGALPTPKTMAELAELARDLNLTYNVHLPTDIFLGDENKAVRQQAVDTLLRVRDLTAPLNPTTLTLHLLPSPRGRYVRDLGLWQDCLRKSLGRLFAGGIDPESISVETLDYPFEWVEGIVSDLNLSICMDLGHLLVHRYDMQALFVRNQDRVSIIHLHGVEGKRDHLALNRMGTEDMNAAMDILCGFTGVVSIEVFSFQDLAASLPVLEKSWRPSPSNSV
ncbi:MAG: sugar phosphate isomerase/epimerase [Desulfobacterales bacterium]|nr:sugar phosphate isomerase/epimerase [Desulfobacterales bacterium]